jgi:hypothetical protein
MSSAAPCGDDLVARSNQMVLQNSVDVERQLRVPRVALVTRVQRVDVVRGGERLVEPVGRRIGRVARSEQVVLPDERSVEDEVGGGERVRHGRDR